MYHRDQLKAVLRGKSVFRGTFTLASGKTSNYYLDCRMTTLDAEGAAMTAYCILELLAREGIHAEAIGGPPLGAHPIVAAVAAISYLEKKPISAFLIRREQKTHGRQKQIEGIELKEGMRVVIVDDVCTRGDSTIEAIEIVEKAGLKVEAVISVVDREEGGSERLRQKYRYFALFTARELIQDDPA